MTLVKNDNLEIKIVNLKTVGVMQREDSGRLRLVINEEGLAEAVQRNKGNVGTQLRRGR